MWNYNVNCSAGIMSDFKELGKPLLEHSHARQPERWFVTATDHRFLVNDGRTLAAAAARVGDNEKLYFSSEIEAYFYSAKYYVLHQKEFPYHDEWYAVEDITEQQALPTEIESEVMKF